ncbi:ABC transporter substrate-binding protein [Cryobacterium sp. N21]|uniref:ABC transporter substrate-binding protein n=1 Tax=Cryobacterium sp. N21 TaxID=2048289 RepID=UPI000CE36933|nr:ABC transporter substrate-binding protein [Cryobacterium sp. N21]
MQRSTSPLNRTKAGAAVVIAGLLLTGCASAEATPEHVTDEATTVRVAVQAIADFAPIWLGLEQGFFTDAGIDLQIVEGGASSAAQIPLLLSKSADIAATTAAAALQASASGLEVKIVAGLTDFATNASADQSGLLVAVGSDIKGFADLEGKTVAISGLKSVSEAVISAAVDAAGGDSSKVSFIQGPMPTLGDMVVTGGAQATFLIDPFLTLATKSGLEVLGRPFADVAPGVPGTSLVASTEYAAANPGVIKKFREALKLSAAFANENPDRVNKALSAEAKVPLEMLEGTTVPKFVSVVDPQRLEVEAAMLRKYGALEGTGDTSNLVVPE